MLPEISLLDLENKNHTFKSLLKKNKLNLVLFYNTNCLGCTGRAIPLAYDLQKEYDFIELIVVHSNFRPQPFEAEEVLSVFVDQKSPIPIYREEKHALFSHFDCDGTPHWLILDDEGEVKHSIFGSQDGAQIKLGYAIQEFEQTVQ